MAKGVLVDLTKCIGCSSCAVACKMWNGLQFEDGKSFQGTDAKLNDLNWTVVKKHEVKDRQDKPVWRYVKEQCFHCQEPACVSACFSRALERNQDGAVVYYPSLCVGCRYCMVACPFDIPKYEWDRRLPQVAKCQMCSTKIAQGEAPACVSVCPTAAIQFGDRDEMLTLAEGTIAEDAKYVKHIYGAAEVGGTAWLYISDVPFAQLGFKTDIGTKPLPEYTQKFIRQTPFIAVGWGALLVALSLYTKRRNRIAREKGVADSDELEMDDKHTNNGTKRDQHESS